MFKKTATKLFIFPIVLCNLVYAEDLKKLDAVTITASKVEENILSIPQSVSVIQREDLEEKNIDNVTKLIEEIPNMNSSSISGMGTFTNFRGINTSVFNIFSAPIVFYVDGIPTINRFVYETSLLNAKRVEVLKGPQGTLYGKDSIGAVVNIITEDTPQYLNGYISTEYGNNNYSKTSFNINTPLIDNKLYGGINGQYKRTDGFVTNHYNNDDKSNKSWSYDINSYLKYIASDNLSLKFTFNKSKSKDYGSKSATYTSSLLSLDESSVDDTENANYELPSNEQKDIISQSLALKYNFNKLDLDWILSHKDVDFDGMYDMDFANGTSYDGTTQYNNFTTKSYSNELRLSNNKDKNTWVLGIFNEYEKFDESTGYGNYSFYGTYDASGKIKSKTNAIFGQTKIPLFNDFELTLGGRYQKIDKDANINVSIENYPSSNFNFTSKKSWNIFLPKIALAYRAYENTTPYLSISKGYMPGGFNTFPSSPNTNENTFDAQTSTNYELGLKSMYDDFEFNSSLFYMSTKDLQVYRVDSSTGAWNVNNADKAHSYGIEFEGRYYINDNFDLSGSIGLLRAVYDKYNAGNNNNFKGKDIENTPSHKANISLSYHGDKGLYGIFSIYNRGSISFYDNSTQKFLDEGSVTTANIKIGQKFSNLDIFGYVNNITDNRYVTGYFSKGILSSVSYNEKRFFGIGLKYSF